jgi:hypothetical protein
MCRCFEMEVFQHHFICDVMDGHGIDGYRHARIEEFVDRIATFNFESYLTQAIGGTVSGGFCIEKDEHQTGRQCQDTKKK